MVANCVLGATSSPARTTGGLLRRAQPRHTHPAGAIIRRVLRPSDSGLGSRLGPDSKLFARHMHTRALPSGFDGNGHQGSGLGSHRRAPGLWSPPAGSGPQIDPAQDQQQQPKRASQQQQTPKKPPPLPLKQKQKKRGSVAARTEALRRADIHDSSAFSAAVMELDTVVQRRARRQYLISKLDARRIRAGAMSWALRSAVSVMLSASLVLDGSLHHMAHGYGIWAIITCVNCNEKLQGDLFRKSLERAAGTLIGSAAAMFVLLIDDSIVPEFLGWNARADFYLIDVALFTIAGFYARSMNKAAPAMDYIYFMAVLSFDFLLLDSFSDLNEYQDGLQRILMVCAGGVLTCGVGTVLLPQYAGQELLALSASAFEGTATALEVTASMLVMAGSASTHGPSALPPAIQMAQVKRLAYLSKWELRVFPPAEPCSEGGEGGSVTHWPRLAFQMPWEGLTPAFQAAQDLRDVCTSATMFMEAGKLTDEASAALDDLAYTEAFEVELVVVVEEAAGVLRSCANRLRSSWKQSSRSSGVVHNLRLAMQGRSERPKVQPMLHTYQQPPPWDDVDEGLVRFEAALALLHDRLRSCSPRLKKHDNCSLDVHNHYSLADLQLAAVRLLAVRIREKLQKCVESVREAEAAGLLEAPCPFPPTLK